MKDNTAFWPWFETLKPDLFLRANSYERIFKYLDTLSAPIIIVETGCMRRDPAESKSWKGDGCSTMLFDHYVQHRGGTVYSVDINPKHVAACRAFVSEHVEVHCGDSVAHLSELAKTLKPDLVYLDSFDSMSIEPFETALHCAKEFDAIKPSITDMTLVVIDDTPSEFMRNVEPAIEVTGKGRFVYTYAQHIGADTLFSGWQVGWIHMVGVRFQSSYDQVKLGRYGKFIDPDNDLDKLIERAREHVENDRASAAATVYRAIMVMTKEPRSGKQRVARGESCAFYARSAAAVGMYGTACDWYRDAIIADPRCVDYRMEMARKGHIPLVNFQLAQQEAIRCTLLEPDNPRTWGLLGDVELSLCNAKAAKAAYEKQLEIIPDDPSAMLDMCVIALDTADYDTVRELAEKVLKTERKADGMHVLAMIENRAGRHERAIEMFTEALEAGCNNQAIARWNRSLSLLAIGRFKEGWAEHEFRKTELRNPALSLAFQRFTRPLYEGQSPEIDGRKAVLLIHAEAGMGDNFAFVRFLPEFVKKGFHVRYESHPEMLDLMQRSFPDVEVVPRAPDYPGAIGLKNFDYHLPLGSMAHVLGMDIDTIPTFDSYLKVDPELLAKYKELLSLRKRAGLCWSSGIREYGIWIAEYGRRKSMHFQVLEQLIETIYESGRQPVNLQVGPERAQHFDSIRDVLPEKPTWNDTAALIANLDLVITVDTAVAHLAGALGKPTWLMMQQDGASWHFMSERPGALWKPGDWSGVVERVAKELGRAS